MTIKTIRRMVSQVCMIAAAGLILSACGSETEKSDNNTNNTDPAACKSNELKATVNMVTGCYTKCDNGECATGTCTKGICIGDTTTDPTNPNNKPDPNNSQTTPTTGNTTPTTGNTTPTTGNTTPPDPVADPVLVKLCEDTFEKFFVTCTAELCTLGDDSKTRLAMISAGQQPEQCALDLANDATQKANFEAILAGECAPLKPQYCTGLGIAAECGCAPAEKVGEACAMDAQCEGGDVQTACIAESDQNGLTGGMCIAFCADDPNQFPMGGVYRNSDECGANNTCFIQVDPNDANNRNGLCLDGCANDTECGRDGYSCVILGFDVTTNPDKLDINRVCLPPGAPATCGSNADCNGGNGSCENGICNPKVPFGCIDQPFNGGNSSTLTAACAENGGTCTMINGASFCVLP